MMARNLKNQAELKVQCPKPYQGKEQNRALVVSKNVYNRFIDYTTENARLAELTEQRAAKLAKLKAASYEMSKDWNDAFRNIKKKRQEEILWRRERTDEYRKKLVKEMRERNAEQRAEIVNEARKLLFYKQPQCRIINSALFTSECYRELHAQLAFREKLRDADKGQDDVYAELLKNDTEKFFEEEKQKAEERLKKTHTYSIELKKQIEDTSNNLQRLELIEARADEEDLDNMEKEEKMIKQCETEQLLKKKEYLKEMFLNQLEEKKQLEDKMKEEEDIENRYIEAYRSARDHLNRITKMKWKEEQVNKVKRSENIAKKCAAVYESNDGAENERIAKAVAEKDKLEKERNEAERQFREKMRADIKRYAAEAAALKEKRQQEEKHLIEWEAHQRCKRDEYNRELKLKVAIEEDRRKKEIAEYLRKQMAEQKNTRDMEKIMDDDSEAVQKAIQKTNEKILAYGQRVLDESKGVRPLFPIIKVIENFKKENNLLPPKSVEEPEPPQPKRRMKKPCLIAQLTAESFCLG